jgi:hypothetical protein
MIKIQPSKYFITYHTGKCPTSLGYEGRCAPEPTDGSAAADEAMAGAARIADFKST